MKAQSWAYLGLVGCRRARLARYGTASRTERIVIAQIDFNSFLMINSINALNQSRPLLEPKHPSRNHHAGLRDDRPVLFVFGRHGVVPIAITVSNPPVSPLFCAVLLYDRFQVIGHGHDDANVL
jgi:hypothetical protein